MVCFSFAEVCFCNMYVTLVSVCVSWFINLVVSCTAVYLQGPLAWALIVWRCSLVFSSPDKIVSVLIHLLPGALNALFFFLVVGKKISLVLQRLCFSGLVFFTIRWWNPATFAAMRPMGTDRRVSWPYVEDKSYLFTWLFLIPLVVYTLWQVLYFLIVNVLRRQRLLRDPEVMTSYRYQPVASIISCWLTMT